VTKMNMKKREGENILGRRGGIRGLGGKGHRGSALLPRRKKVPQQHTGDISFRGEKGGRKKEGKTVFSPRNPQEEKGSTPLLSERQILGQENAGLTASDHRKKEAFAPFSTLRRGELTFGKKEEERDAQFL